MDMKKGYVTLTIDENGSTITTDRLKKAEIDLLKELIAKCKNGVIEKSKLEKMLNEKLRYGQHRTNG